MKQNKRKNRLRLPMPAFVRKLEDKVLDFLDWIAPVVDWVGDQAERYKAASDAVPPPSKHWVKRRKVSAERLTVTLFLLFLTVMTVLALYLPIRPTWSNLENRTLTEFPTPTVVRVLNGSFFDDINTWFADTFPLRERFLAAQNTMESFYGLQSHKVVGDVAEGDEIPETAKTDDDTSQSDDTEETVEPAADASAAAEEVETADASSSVAVEQPVEEEEPAEDEPVTEDDDLTDDIQTLGALLVIRDAAYEYYNFVQDTADDYIDLVNRAAELLEGQSTVYDLVVPNSMDICVSEKIRKSINTSDQQAALNYLYSSMSSQVQTVNVYDLLSEHQAEGEYLYFRTDHHWTALGAYYAYTAFAEAAGKEAASLDDYQAYTFEGFTGSFYRETESAAMLSNPDTVYAYGPTSTNTVLITQDDGSQISHTLIGDGDSLSAVDKYLTFLGGDHPLTVIENPDITDGSAVMIIKESYGNCFAPFLVENYQYVYVVDYRYIADVDSRTLPELAEDYDVDDVIFVHSISATRDSSSVKKMASFVG
ncbi:MAG: hypothetical protein LUE89_04025 [Clostridiales bacterium]|nr:hypothetical protein [Clostridiales bacterium]